MSLRSWVVGSLVVVLLAGCSGASRGGGTEGSGEAGAGDGTETSGGTGTNGGTNASGGSGTGGGPGASGSSPVTGGGTNSTGGTNPGGGTNSGGGAEAGGGRPDMTAGGAEGGSNETGPGGAGGTDSPDACAGVTCESPPPAVCDTPSALTTYDAVGSCTNGTCSYASHSTACACNQGACDTDPCLAVSCSTPPAASCKDSTHLVAYSAAGTCAGGSCSYPGTETFCEFGCKSGACQPNPCAGITCDQPPATTCKDGVTKVEYSVNGVCSQGSCSYSVTETQCTFGCDKGPCFPDPCLGVTCSSPPAPSCDSPTQLRTYDKVGSCAAGACAYQPHLTACSCQAGACVVDPCQSLTCDAPPAPTCKTSTTLTSYAKTGTCKAGSCTYAAQDKACAFGCENGACKADPCAALTCDQPPAAICKDASTKTTYATKGTCSGGKCAYLATNSVCAFGCENGACKADPCDAVTCSQPPAATCKDADTKTTYAAKGTCSGGNCSYAATNSICAFGCENGACKADPCAGVACDQPPANTCKNASTKTTYAAKGSCSEGNCSYTSTDTSCAKNQQCEGAGVCAVCGSDDSCGPNCTACAGETPKCKLTGSASKCVACLSDLDCGGANPKCNTATNVCGPQPSCIGLAKTCGPNGDQDCCASGLVTGGTFNRSDNPKYPATVSSFRFDKYEITIGRFRKFIAAYEQNMTAAGTGRNPNNPNDPGWDGYWNTYMPADKAGLIASLKCNNGGPEVWQDSVGTAETESLPLPCVSWLAAEAFCIWDGGRLPTDAEWDYAASGGDEQRLYPWGDAAPDCAHANSGSAPCGDHVNRVGSESPLGDGRWGQSDLAGNLSEYTQDWLVTSNQTNDAVYASTTCNNCAELAPRSDRVMWGGHFTSDLSLGFQVRSGGSMFYGSPYVGARCARMP